MVNPPNTLTLDMLAEAQRKIIEMCALPASMLHEQPMSTARQVQMQMAGLRIIFSSYALEATAERLFPASKHRSKRIRKKLIKRFGSEYRMVPVIWQAGNVIYAHPALREKLRRAVDQANVKW